LYRNTCGHLDVPVTTLLACQVHEGENTAMAAVRTFAGIDGCRAGWFCVILAGRSNGSCHVVPDADALARLICGVDCALIDIPIGLIDSGNGGRLCDREARRLLGPGRAASVFSAPARRTLDAPDYRVALELNRQATGRGLSKQAWNLVPKIREIDVLLQRRKALRGVLRECHPELCFRGLNGGRSMHYNKKRPEGRQERLAVLERYYPKTQALFRQASGEFPRSEVVFDDIIDAMVCAVTARSGRGRYRIVPVMPLRDGRGLRMEMVCYEPGR